MNKAIDLFFRPIRPYDFEGALATAALKANQFVYFIEPHIMSDLEQAYAFREENLIGISCDRPSFVRPLMPAPREKFAACQKVVFTDRETAERFTGNCKPDFISGGDLFVGKNDPSAARTLKQPEGSVAFFFACPFYRVEPCLVSLKISKRSYRCKRFCCASAWPSLAADIFTHPSCDVFVRHVNPNMNSHVSKFDGGQQLPA
ncbi:MAG: hypothetical protein ACFB11_21425 [Paracoccaceae bacterium]